MAAIILRGAAAPAFRNFRQGPAVRDCSDQIGDLDEAFVILACVDCFGCGRRLDAPLSPTTRSVRTWAPASVRRTSETAYDYGYYGGYHDRDVAWKAIAGIRPIPFVGAEAQWIDFGSGHGDNGYFGFGDYYANSSLASEGGGAVRHRLFAAADAVPRRVRQGGRRPAADRLTTFQYTSGGYCPPPYIGVQRADGVSHRPVEQQVRMGRGRGDALAGFRFPRRIRAHRFATTAIPRRSR